MRPDTRAGFSLVAAIFLLVVLSLLGALIASVTGISQSSSRLDLLGVRAYHAARAGMEWGTYRVLDPGNTLNLNPVTCSPVDMPPCPAPSTNLPALGGALSGFTVTVTCEAADATEVNRSVRVFQITSTASDGTVSRQVQATVSKCKDPTATHPRCLCG